MCSFELRVIIASLSLLVLLLLRQGCCCACRLQTARSVLLYGPAGSGKTLAATAVAHQSGAMLFDLSPAATAGKFPGQEAALMVHKVRVRVM
jgi:ATP-dependent 26S proteasome regulatory subunit